MCAHFKMAWMPRRLRHISMLGYKGLCPLFPARAAQCAETKMVRVSRLALSQDFLDNYSVRRKHNIIYIPSFFLRSVSKTLVQISGNIPQYLKRARSYGTSLPSKVYFNGYAAHCASKGTRRERLQTSPTVRFQDGPTLRRGR